MVGTTLLIGFGIMVVLIALGTPIFPSIGLATIFIFMNSELVTMNFYASTLFNSLNSFVLLAIPFFVLTGDLLSESDLSEDLVEFSDTLFGGIQASVGTATVFGCGLFASISGSNASDAAAIGRIMYGDLKNYGYPGDYSSALIASGASTGILIPPSIVYIVAGLVLGISASKLFLAAFIPGMCILFGVIGINIGMNHANDYENGTEFAGIRNVLEAIWQAKLALFIPFIILGGIYSGIFTPTESAAIAVATVVLFGIVRGSLSLRSLPDVLERSAIINGMVAPIVATALVLAQIFSLYNIPTTVVDALLATVGSKAGIILIMFLLFIIGGAIMDTGPNIVILGPLLLPVATEIGMSPIHFTVFMVTTLGVGFITPPFGLNLFIMSGVTGEPVDKIARKAVPFTIGLLLISLGIAFFPQLFMWMV